MSAAPGLEHLQAMMQAHVLLGDASIVAAIADRGRLDVAERLGIYHHAYRARLAETLRDSYGHTATLAGDAFEALAGAFVQSHASSESSLRGYGSGFPEWLASEDPDRPELAEVAALDRALRRAFDCADSPAMSLTGLAAIEPAAWGSAVFRFSQSYDRLRVEHNAIALWQAIDDDEPPPAVVRLPRRPDILVWRRGLSPHFRSLAPFEAAALDLLHGGQDFAATCGQLATAFPGTDVAAEAGTLLRRWVEEEILASIGVSLA